MATNIFLIKTTGRATKYGVGSYIETIKDLLLSRKDVNLFVVQILTGTTPGVGYVDNGKCRELLIRLSVSRKEAYTTDGLYIDEVQARAIYGILFDFMTEEGTNIIHLNSVLETQLAEIAKEYVHCKVVYAMHVLLWQVFFKNSFARFSREWQERADTKRISSMKAEQRLCELADKIVCLTPGAVRFAMDHYGARPAKLKIIHNVINCEHIYIPNVAEKEQMRKKYGFSGSQMIVIFSGRLIYEKGLTFAIDALSRLHCKEYDFHFLICGDGDYSKVVDRSRSFTGKVSFAGFVDKKMLYEFYQLADVGILPSFREQNSFSALEMMAHGLPVIVCDMDAFSQFSRTEAGVIRLPVNKDPDSPFIDLDQLEHKLEEVMGDPERWRQAGKDAGCMIRKCFSLDNMDIHELYGL